MPDEPIEEQIEAAIAARLATIQAGAEYWMTPEVTRELLPIDQYKDAELVDGLLGVMRASGSTAVEDTRDPGLLHSHRVAIWGYVAGQAGLSAGTMLNRLARDARRCLMADWNLGTGVLDLTLDGPRDTDEGAREPKAFFRQHWLATASEAL